MFGDLFSRQFLHFIFAGSCSAAVSIISRIIFQLEFSYFVSVFFASVIGMFVNFFINKNLVFKSYHQELSTQFIKFLFIASISLILTPVSASALLQFFSMMQMNIISYSMAELFAHIGALIINSIYGFFAIKYFVFNENVY